MARTEERRGNGCFKEMKCGKPSELANNEKLKYGSDGIIEWLMRIFNRCIHISTVPEGSRVNSPEHYHIRETSPNKKTKIKKKINVYLRIFLKTNFCCGDNVRSKNVYDEITRRGARGLEGSLHCCRIKKESI